MAETGELRRYYVSMETAWNRTVEVLADSAEAAEAAAYEHRMAEGFWNADGWEPSESAEIYTDVYDDADVTFPAVIA